MKARNRISGALGVVLLLTLVAVAPPVAAADADICDDGSRLLREAIREFVTAGKQSGLITDPSLVDHLPTEGTVDCAKAWSKWLDKAAGVALDIGDVDEVRLPYSVVQNAREDALVAGALCRRYRCGAPSVMCFDASGDFLLGTAGQTDGCHDGVPNPAEPGQKLTVLVFGPPDIADPVVELRASADRSDLVRRPRARPIPAAAPPPAALGFRVESGETKMDAFWDKRAALGTRLADTKPDLRTSLERVPWLVGVTGRTPGVDDRATTRVWSEPVTVLDEAPANLLFLDVAGRLWRMWLRPRKYYIDFAILFPFVFDRQQAGERPIPGTGEKVYTRDEQIWIGVPKLGVTVYPFGHCDDVVTSWTRPCGTGVFGLQAAFTPDFASIGKEVYFGAFLEIVSGFNVGGGVAILETSVLPEGIEEGDLVPTIGAPSARQEVSFYGYFGLTLTLELFQLFKERSGDVGGDGQSSAGSTEGEDEDKTEPEAPAPPADGGKPPAGGDKLPADGDKPPADGGTPTAAVDSGVDPAVVDQEKAGDTPGSGD